MMRQIRTLALTGAPFERGWVHGNAYANEIGHITEKRLALCTDAFWLPNPATMDEVMTLGNACLEHHQRFAPGLMEELRGTSEATGVGLTELLIMNGFTDFVDVLINRDGKAAQIAREPAQQRPALADEVNGCTAFIVDASFVKEGQGYVGQTWDMDTTATPHVLLLDVRPNDGPNLLTYTITGCVGMIGINEHGVSVCINNLSGADGRPGVMWVFVVREMLAQRTVDAALDVLLGVELAGAHNYLLMGPSDASKHGDERVRGFNVEAMATQSRVSEVHDALVHTNHCLAPGLLSLERARTPVSLESTNTRLSQASEFLARHPDGVGRDDLLALTRVEVPGALSIAARTRPGFPIETVGACLLSPSTREMWALWGNPNDSEYERFAVARREAVPV